MRVAFILLLLFGMTEAVCATSFEALLNRESKADSVEVTGVTSSQGEVTLRLTQFDPIAADARLVLANQKGEQLLPRPSSRFYRGEAVGSVTGRAYVAVHADRFLAMVETSDGTMLMKRAGAGFLLTKVSQIEAERPPFQCMLDHNHAMQNPNLHDAAEQLLAGMPSNLQYSARLAIETDQEYLALFAGNTTDAINYVSSVVGYLSTLYGEQVDTSIQLSYVRLWATTDPWVQNNSSCMMLELGKYWNDNMTSESRAVVHMLSGKDLGTGVAWLGVLCSAPFDTAPANLGVTCPGLNGTSNYGGAYSVTAGITGAFDPGAPAVIWDTYAMAHELGHNFNSPHTHCYGGIGGVEDQVDHCSFAEAGDPGCWTGPRILPGPPDSGSGTIMSYCHRVRFTYSDISMSFGEGHAYGNAPERVNQRMRAYVQAQSASYPACLPATENPAIFRNGFE